MSAIPNSAAQNPLPSYFAGQRLASPGDLPFQQSTESLVALFGTSPSRCVMSVSWVELTSSNNALKSDNDPEADI